MYNLDFKDKREKKSFKLLRKHSIGEKTIQLQFQISGDSPQKAR